MTEMARKRRWSRFVDRQSGKALIVPIDHGLTLGPLEGLNRVEEVQRWLDPDVVSGIVAHKGFAERLGGAPGCGLMIHLNGSLNIGETPDFKEMLTSVEAAIRLGADAVSIQANFSAVTAGHNLRMIGQAVDQAHAYGLPILCMVYDKGPMSGKDMIPLRHFMRAAVELGVDALKVAAPENLNDIPSLVDGIQEHTPVLFAGGALADEMALLELATAVCLNGTGGICVGRNVFQRADPLATMTRLRDLFRDSAQAMDFSRPTPTRAAALEN
ncbi:class I fructose-bisphosphate aldolase [Paludibacterium purpuratum]|uniref:Class I fructose-bisphosphate aldolase/fructose-bisphosphate aldolase/2-amino-3,7-dideoxy-D-threo-hept-6-ulosonate synthase n=1 Tax=Paludibacterium purpuratum TaxID=1144873 RepID=A0A4R7B522_9NEIS|nr:aldolase [Paludibacterium purpuratum]TDR79754.1 class I fructose-bisphosphate aldolase/fructose-bisphosphate aldolase/2-amino-3,7-dideoxy-D-threo-hept-6-ulosonate synthase [Paludibacterium purpuratum]